MRWISTKYVRNHHKSSHIKRKTELSKCVHVSINAIMLAMIICVFVYVVEHFFFAKHAYSNANHGRDFYIVFVADFG